MFGLSKPTVAIMLKCGMVEDLLEIDQKIIRGGLEGITDYGLQTRLASDKQELQGLAQKLNQWHVEDVVKSYKNNYMQIARDFTTLDRNHPVQAAEKLKGLTQRVHDLIVTKKNEENNEGILSRFGSRIAHFFQGKGFNTEAEYAEKIYAELAQELTVKNRTMGKDALKNWAGGKITEQLKAAVNGLSLKEIEQGAKGELFKLKARQQKSWATFDFAGDRSDIMELFSTEEQKHAFLRGVAQRNDCLLQVNEFMEEISHLDSHTSRLSFELFVNRAKGTGIEAAVLNQFLAIYQKFLDNQKLSLEEEELLNKIKNPPKSPVIYLESVDQAQIRQRTPAYLKQYIAELLIREMDPVGLAAILKREEILGGDNDIRLRDVMRNLYNGTLKPALLTDEQLQQFKESLKISAFGKPLPTDEPLQGAIEIGD